MAEAGFNARNENILLIDAILFYLFMYLFKFNLRNVLDTLQQILNTNNQISL